MEAKEIYDQVNRRYGSIVKSCTGQHEQTVAKAFGYTEEELSDLPQGANLGLSCGNPVALARLREGETVVDLGSGAGFDVFIAAKKVGPTGRAIGLDMNKNMIDKANANKAHINASNIQFIESAITSVALADNIANCIISNCVINLIPAQHKQLAFSEMFRVLKPGGRLAISDILARKEYTEEIKNDMALYVECIAGASQVGEYENFLKNAGFNDVLIVDNKNDLNVYFTAAEAKSSSHPGTDAVQEEQKAPSCCSTDAEASCCKPGEKKSCCESNLSTCARQKPSRLMATDDKTRTSQLGITDLNEWAGKCTRHITYEMLPTHPVTGSFQVYAVKPAAD